MFLSCWLCSGALPWLLPFLNGYGINLLCIGVTPSTIAIDAFSHFGDVSPYHHQQNQPTLHIQQAFQFPSGPPPVPPPMAPSNDTIPNRATVIPPLNLSMESLTPYADEDITVTSGYDGGGRSPAATTPGHVPLIQIEPESGRINYTLQQSDTNTPPELKRR